MIIAYSVLNDNLVPAHRVDYNEMMKWVGSKNRISFFLLLPLLCCLCACAGGGEGGPAPSAARIVATALPDTPEPVLCLTPEPTPAPTPEPTPAPTPDPAVADAFFDDAVFVGDSLTVGLKTYAGRQRRTGVCLDHAAFVAGEGVSVRSVRYGVTPEKEPCMSYRDKYVSIPKGIRQSGKSRVFLLLGTNDLAGLHLTDTLSYYVQLLDLIAEKCPDATVTVLSVPPVTRSFCDTRGFDIADWNRLNPALAEVCAARGLDFIDFSAQLSDDGGYLREDYSSDGAMHLGAEGYAVWLSALYAYAAEKAG